MKDENEIRARCHDFGCNGPELERTIEELKAALSAERAAREAAQRDAERLDWMDTLQHRTDGKKWPIASDCHAHHGRWAIYVRTGIGSNIAAEGWGDTIREAIDAAQGSHEA